MVVPLERLVLVVVVGDRLVQPLEDVGAVLVAGRGASRIS